MDDDDFSQLPLSLQSLIDDAFDKAQRIAPDPVAAGLVPSAAKKHLAHDDGELTNYHDEDSEGGGGFLIEDDDAGGFIRDEASENSDSKIPAHRLTDSIGLSLIPTAMQFVDLPPDDEDVLDTFRNAAGGWGELADGEEGVTRKDWREVCAILLKHRVGPNGAEASMAEDGNDEVGGGFIPSDELMESDADDSEDEYHGHDENGSLEPSNSGSSDDDYDAHRVSRTKSRNKKAASKSKHRAGRGDSDASPSPAPVMTRRQRGEALKTFALFFPDVPADKLSSHKIMIKDIGRVASLLSIRVKTEEIVEMLESFSSSADKSISLTDFENLVMVAKLV